MAAHAYKLQTSAMFNAELKASCQPSGEVSSTKPAAYKSPFLAYLEMANTAPWNCHLLLDMLLPWIISAKSGRSLTICKGTGKLKLFLLSGGSLEDATDPLKGHSKPGTSK